MASEDNTATAPAKAKTEYEKVVMADGREVEFPGKRQILKTVTIDEAAATVAVRFDFRNGKVLSLGSTELGAVTQLQSLGHGLAQKCGDEAAGEKKIDDIVAAVEDMMGRLRKGEWNVPRQPGDSFSGTSVVIRAVAEVTGKSAEDVKAFLQGKLDKAKAEGKALSRQELYASFRKPGTRTAEVIRRIEEEDAAGKTTKVSADDLLGELTA
jgi:hypothetical protein